VVSSVEQRALTSNANIELGDSQSKIPWKSVQLFCVPGVAKAELIEFKEFEMTSLPGISRKGDVAKRWTLPMGWSCNGRWRPQMPGLQEEHDKQICTRCKSLWSTIEDKNQCEEVFISFGDWWKSSRVVRGENSGDIRVIRVEDVPRWTRFKTLIKYVRAQLPNREHVTPKIGFWLNRDALRERPIYDEQPSASVEIDRDTCWRRWKERFNPQAAAKRHVAEMQQKWSSLTVAKKGAVVAGGVGVAALAGYALYKALQSDEKRQGNPFKGGRKGRKEGSKYARHKSFGNRHGKNKEGGGGKGIVHGRITDWYVSEFVDMGQLAEVKSSGWTTKCRVGSPQWSLAMKEMIAIGEKPGYWIRGHFVATDRWDDDK